MVPKVTLAFAACILTACSAPAQLPKETLQATKTVTVAPSSAPSTAYVASPSPTVSGPKAVIEMGGTYLVGVDIVPGIYRTPGGTSCYWARLNSLDTSDIIDNNNSSGPQVVEILPTDRAFLTENCQQWTLASASTAVAAAPPAANSGTPISLPGADAQGFSDGPRCSYRAALMIRTAQSQAVVCDEGSGRYTYEGLRLKDSARIDLPGALPTGTGFTVQNTDGTRYEISRSGLAIYTPDGQVYPETAIAAGP